jgi:hypothetical protein
MNSTRMKGSSQQQLCLLLLLLVGGVFLCSTTTAKESTIASGDVSDRAAPSSETTAFNDRDYILSSTTTTDPASILLKDYIDAIHKEEALQEKVDPDKERLAQMQALNQEMLNLLKPIVMNLFDPQVQSTEDAIKLIYRIYARERKGSGVDSDGKINKEEFQKWFKQKLGLADAIREKMGQDKLRSKRIQQRIDEVTYEFKQQMDEIFQDFGDSLRSFQEKRKHDEAMRQIIPAALTLIIYVVVRLGYMLYKILFTKRDSRVKTI